MIEPPEDFVPAYFTNAQPLVWTFKGYSAKQLDELWQQASVDAGLRQKLNDPTRQTVSGDAIILHPTPEIALALSPESRGKIYTALAAFPENAVQRDPFRCRAEAIADWFEDEPLPPEIIGLTKRLLYRRGNSILFSDHDLVIPHLPSIAERVRFIKALSRKSALLVELKVPHNADVEGLARYWGRGRRSKDVKSLLESLSQRPEGGTIDISHLLPPLARLLLYTYPVPSDRPVDAARDCHWTSLNFLRDTPDDRFLNLDFVQQTLLNDYYQVGSEPAMGDIVMLVEPGGRGVHSCVYIANDIVFTKNGSAFSVPWTLAQLESVVAFYSLTEPLEVRRYRAK